MMNVLAFGLLLTSLVTAGFISPSPETQHAEDVIVKEGHRVVVVEFEKGDGNTKVSISPQDTHPAHKVDDKMSESVDNANKVKEASSAFIPKGEEAHHEFSPRELVCDAYGKCKHKIASAIGKTKDTAHEVEEDAKEAVGKVKDSVTGTAHKASDKAHETKESVTDAVGEVWSAARGKIAEKASEMKEGAKRKVNDVLESTQKLKEEAKSQAGKKTEGAKEMVSEKAAEAREIVEEVKEGASKVKKQGQKKLSKIARHAREVMSDAFGYVVSPEGVASVTGILHLMAFSAAYGICLWITFASSYVLAAALPRHQFAMVQSKIYPVYFKAMACSVGMALLGHLMGSKRFSPFSVGTFQGFNLLASLGMILANLLYLEPRATKVLFDRMKKEKEEGRGKESHTTCASPGVRSVDSLGEAAGRATIITTTTTIAEGAASRDKAEEASEIFRLSDILRRLNSYSSLLNILTLMSLSGHLVHLGQHVHLAC